MEENKNENSRQPYNPYSSASKSRNIHYVGYGLLSMTVISLAVLLFTKKDKKFVPGPFKLENLSLVYDGTANTYLFNALTEQSANGIPYSASLANAGSCNKLFFNFLDTPAPGDWLSLDDRVVLTVQMPVLYTELAMPCQTSSRTIWDLFM